MFDEAAIPGTFSPSMVAGLREHLWRYSGQQSSRNTLARLDDAAWLAAWDTALRATRGAAVLLRGSELGVLALRARHHGARHVFSQESFPLDTRITTGVIQKHCLRSWHSLHGGSIGTMTEDERRSSFEDFTKDIDVVPPGGGQMAGQRCDYFVFPDIDHSLLGTGIVKAIAQYRTSGDMTHTRILPARARVFAMGIAWTYPTPYRLHPLNELRWNFRPEAFDVPDGGWRALTAPVEVGEIDFEHFVETDWLVHLPLLADGTLDGIVFWFDLDLGASHLSNAPGGTVQCIKPAVQYTDAIEGLTRGQVLPLRVRVGETRLHFHTQPPASRLRSHRLPGWYLPMLLDEARNAAYRAVIAETVAAHPPGLVLDIGAGCGLLSMMAAEAGAARVVGCEAHAAICAVGNDIVRLNGFADRITLVDKDCRALGVPGDLPARADLAVFELFDCSLIGEGVLHFLAYAREHLLTDAARYRPMRATLRGMVIEYRLDRAWNIDLNLLNPYRYSPSFINVDAARLAHRRLTEPVDLFSFDFSSAVPVAAENELRLPAIEAGTAGAVLFWFDLQLDERTFLSNAPSPDNSLHWKQGLQFLPEVSVAAAAELPVIARHDGSSLSFRWKPDAFPKEALSKLPRFDPRWLAAANQLEEQTRGLLEHCMRDHAEFIKVAELAKRYAVDPASHGLDPLIAQRFAGAFF